MRESAKTTPAITAIKGARAEKTAHRACIRIGMSAISSLGTDVRAYRAPHMPRADTPAAIKAPKTAMNPLNMVPIHIQFLTFAISSSFPATQFFLICNKQKSLR